VYGRCDHHEVPIVHVFVDFFGGDIELVENPLLYETFVASGLHTDL
jgi:hypothetical protein